MPRLYEKEEEEAELTRARELINKAQEFANQGRTKNAMHVYLKVIDIYLDLGKFMKVSEIFSELVSLASMETEILTIKEKLRRTIDYLNSLDLFEEVAKLELALANLAYKSKDYNEAANLFSEVAEKYLRLGDEYKEAAGMFLIRAAECYEKINKSEKAERIIYKAIKTFDVSNFNYNENFHKLEQEIKKKKFEDAIHTIEEIQAFLDRLKSELNKIEEENSTITNLKNNVRARLIQMHSEYSLLKILCLKWEGKDEEMLEETKKTINEVLEAIEVMKKEIKKGYFTTADLHRLTFNMFLLQVLQEFANYYIEDTIDATTYGLPPETIEILKKMQFYEYTLNVIKIDLYESRDLIEDMPLSQILTPFREFIMKSIETFCKK